MPEKTWKLLYFFRLYSVTFNAFYHKNTFSCPGVSETDALDHEGLQQTYHIPDRIIGPINSRFILQTNFYCF